MSRIPHVDLGSKYSYVAAAMSGGLEKLISTNFKKFDINSIPINVLKEAKELFDTALEATGDNVALNPGKYACFYYFVAVILRKATNKEYTQLQLNSEIESLSKLTRDLEKGEVMQYKQGYVLLQNFFKNLRELSEANAYDLFMSGKTSEFTYAL